MASTTRMLVVIDPTQEEHPALDRALRMTKQTAVPVELVFLILASEQTRHKDDLTTAVCKGSWVQETLHAPLEAAGIAHEALISWSRNWSDTLLFIEKSQSIDMTVIPYYGKVDHTLSDENWKLLREAEKPVLIARKNPGEDQLPLRALAAIKAQDDNYADKNAAVIEATQFLAETYNLEMHVVNAYADSMHFPDRGQIARQAELSNEHVHVRLGDPQQVISDVSKEINCVVLVISSQQRKGLKSIMRGNTIEKIIDTTECDILMR